MKKSIGIVLVIVLSILFWGVTSMKDLYVSEVSKELKTYTNMKTQTITEEDIASLPEPVQRFFRYGGYLGQEKMINAKIEWSEAYLKQSPDKDWMKLECYQFNSVPDPMRIAYMKGRILGIFPFEGRDIYQNGQGNMLIKALKIFTVGDHKGKEMDQSALVTILAETFLVPSYALQDYITWVEVDSTTAEARITHNGVEVKGRFFFNDKGEFVRFESEDRFYTDKDGTYKIVKWSAEALSYKEKNGLKFISEMKATWHLDHKDYDYFKGTVSDIKFNIKI